jgi:tetratricopeptide (TPR) repeat protein
MTDPPSTIDGRYRVLHRLGRGGMGSVYRVEDLATGRVLALKQIGGRGDAQGEPRARLRFRREYHCLAHLRHPRIVEVDRFGEDEGGAYYTMELLDGEDLKDVGPLPWRRACEVLRDIGAALACLHARGWLHRDLAPRNVRCTTDGRAKLFDFGLLATVGVVGEVAGTPTSIAPEVRRRLPLDDRTDLYGLGTLAYWILTGRYPYPAKKLDDLEHAWRHPAPPPSIHAPDVPAVLDELVLALCSLDPLGRPSSAAEVIDRLQAVADLPRDPDLAVTEGYLASAAMVGREREMEVLRECVTQAAAGRGRAIFIEAESGTGKSRLLDELGLEASLSGSLVVSARCDGSRWRSYEVVHEIVRQATAAAPHTAAAIDRAVSSIVARVFGDLADRLGAVAESAPVAEPAEERMRIQGALADWLVAFARARPLAIAIDDVQRCDEASAAVLAAVARRVGAVPLLLAVARRTEEPLRAPKPVLALRGADLRLGLSGLDEESVAALLRSLFGDVPHVGRLAAWLHQASGGSPLHCTELMRSLVDARTIRFVDGLWVIPMDVASDRVADGLSHAMDARVSRLSAGTRSLAEVLAIAGGDFDLGEIMALADASNEAEVFSSLDELVAHSVLVGADDRFAFRHDGLREAVLRGLDVERARALHLRMARRLQATPDAAEHEGRIGWHLHEAGELQEAAGHLCRAGARLFRAQALSDCIAPLEAALRILKDRDAPTHERLEPLFMLVAAGWISDRAAGLRHMDAAIAAWREHGGVALAERLGRVVGRHAALVLAVVWMSVVWTLRARSRRGPSPLAALTTFAITVGYAAGLVYANHDLPKLRALVDLARPLAVFSSRIVYATHLGLSAFPDLMLGHLGEARRKLERVLHIVRHDRLSPVGDFERRFAEAGIRSLMAQIQVTNHDPELQATIEVMESLHLRYYELVAGTTRVTDLRFRGREREAAELERELEGASIQLGSWSTDVQLVLFGHPAFGMCNDLINLKRSIDALEHLVMEGFDYRARLEMTRADYHRSRRDLSEARAHYLGALDLLDPEEALTRQWIAVGLAETEHLAGDAEASLHWGETALQLATDPRTVQASVELRAHRVLALAEHALGRSDAAIRRLQAAITRAEALDVAVAAGLLHEARGRIALDLEDHPAFYLHVAEAAKWLRPTGNPSLVAVAERLLQSASASRSGGGRIEDVASDDAVTSVSRVSVHGHEIDASDQPEGTVS